jgi:hypothetical protein
MSRTLLARLLVAVIIGLLLGVTVGKSMERDVAKGKSLTMKEYIEDFDNHRKDLTKGDMALGYAILIVTLMVMVLIGLYEVLVFAMDKLLGLFDRRRELTQQPGTPPPW